MTDALGLGSVLWLLWTNVTDALGLGSVLLLLWTNVTGVRFRECFMVIVD